MRFFPSDRSFIGLVVVGLITLGFPSLFAQNEAPSTNYILSIATDRSDAIYKKSETVTFKVKLLLDQQPVNDAEVQWTISKDGVPPKGSGQLKLTNGGGTLTGQLDEPGFLQCRVTFSLPSNK